MKSHKQQHPAQKQINKEHDEILKMTSPTFIIQKEWIKNGDFFKKLSVYDDYSPIKTSGGTTLLKKI